MSDFSNDAASSMLRVGEKGIDVLAKLLERLFKLLKYIAETKERHINRDLKKAEIEKIRQNKDIEEARNFLNQTRGLVKAKYMQNAGKDLYPISQPMSPTELRRFNELAKTYGLNYYTLQNEAVINQYKAVKKELAQINKEEKLVRDQGLAEHGEHLDQLRQEYAKMQTEIEAKAFVSPADRQRLKNIEKEIKDIEDTINEAALPADRLARKEQLEKQLAALENQRNDVIVVVFKEDLATVENITERMNMEIDLSNIEKEEEQIGKKQILSEADQKRMADLNRQKEDIIRGEFNKFNQDNSEEIINAALDKEKIIYAPQTYTFEDALSRACNRDYAKEPCYICERNNPDNYIKAQSEKMTNKDGRPYNDTSFLIFKNDQQSDKVYHRRATLDGKQTSSRGEDVWSQIKRDMKEQSGMGNDLVVFASKEDYLKYKEEYAKARVVGADAIKEEYEQKVNAAEQKMNREDMSSDTKNQSFRDYNRMINALKAQLTDYKMTLNDQGAVCYSDTLQEVQGTGLENPEKLRCAEAINIGKQINVLKQLNDAQTQLAFIDHQQQLNYDNYNQSDKSEGMKALYESMRDNLHKQSYEVTMNTAVLASQYARLEDELNDIRSVKIVDNIQENNVAMAKEHEKEIDERNVHAAAPEIPHGEEREEHTLNEEQWSQSMQKGGMDMSAVPEPELTITAERE